MAVKLKKMLHYVQEQLGGGMLAEVGMARLGLLLGKNIVKDIEHAHDDPFMLEKMKAAMEKVLNVKEIDISGILGGGSAEQAVKVRTNPDEKPQLYYKVNHDYSKNESVMFGMPLVFHCNHYNAFLQRTIEDMAEYVESDKILIESAAEVSFETLANYFKQNQKYQDPVNILKIAASIFRVNGYGKAVIKPESTSTKRTEIILPHSHYALAWLGKYGSRTKPACYFATGFFQGAVSYAFGKSSAIAYKAREEECNAIGHTACKIIVEE